METAYANRHVLPSAAGGGGGGNNNSTSPGHCHRHGVLHYDVLYSPALGNSSSCSSSSALASPVLSSSSPHSQHWLIDALIHAVRTGIKDITPVPSSRADCCYAQSTANHTSVGGRGGGSGGTCSSSSSPQLSGHATRLSMSVGGDCGGLDREVDHSLDATQTPTRAGVLCLSCSPDTPPLQAQQKTSPAAPCVSSASVPTSPASASRVCQNSSGVLLPHPRSPSTTPATPVRPHPLVPHSKIMGSTTTTRDSLPLTSSGAAFGVVSPVPLHRQRSSARKPTHQRVVIIAIDASAGARHAVKWTRRHILKANDVVVLTTTWEEATKEDALQFKRDASTFLVKPDDVEEYNRSSVCKAQRLISDLYEAYLYELHVFPLIVPLGKQKKSLVGETVCKAARQLMAEMIVVGEHGHSAVSKFFTGSVSKYILDHAACPVVLVKQ